MSEATINKAKLVSRTTEQADLSLDQPGTSSAASRSEENQCEGEYLVKTLSSLELNNDSAVAKLTRIFNLKSCKELNFFSSNKINREKIN